MWFYVLLLLDVLGGIFTYPFCIYMESHLMIRCETVCRSSMDIEGLKIRKGLTHYIRFVNVEA